MTSHRLVPLTRRARPALAALPVVAAAVLLAGCTDQPAPVTPSSSGATTATTPDPSVTESLPTAGEVFRAARTAALAATSGRAVGTITDEGTSYGIDLEGVADGSNQTVFLTTPQGGTAEVLTVGDSYWVGGDEAHWVEITGDAAAGKAMVGKYASITESDATELGAFTLRGILTDAFALPELTVLESNTGAARTTEVDGRAAYVIGQDGGAQLWVAADGSGTLLRVVGSNDAPMDLTFSAWDRARTFTEPAPSKVIEN